MSTVVFYEKPGCVTNAKQKALLVRCGCALMVRDLLSEPWTEARLYEFLQGVPVAEWFNPNAPRITSGEIDPCVQDEISAMALLLQDPLLIRRPLIDCEFGKMVGFDSSPILTALGVHASIGDLPQACSKPDDAPRCTDSG